MENVYYPRNKKVVYRYPDNGYPYDQARAKEFLKEGQTYTLVKVVEHAWNTVYFLKEVPNQGFNSVLFNL